MHKLLAAMKQDIGTSDWMSPATRKEAQVKLSRFTVKVGYPNQWKDDSKLVLDKDDLVGNAVRAVHYDRELNKPGVPIDRAEWATP